LILEKNIGDVFEKKNIDNIGDTIYMLGSFAEFGQWPKKASTTHCGRRKKPQCVVDGHNALWPLIFQ